MRKKTHQQAVGAPGSQRYPFSRARPKRITVIGAQKPIMFFLIHSIRSSNGSLRRFLFLLILSSNSSINLITEHAGSLSRSSFGGEKKKACGISLNSQAVNRSEDPVSVTYGERTAQNHCLEFSLETSSGRRPATTPLCPTSYSKC